MKIYTPRSIEEMEGLVGKLVRLRMNRMGGPLMIETFSGIREIQMSPIGVLSTKYPKKSYYEFLHQFVHLRKDKKFMAYDEISGQLYSTEETKRDFDFSHEGVFLGCSYLNSGYNLGCIEQKEDFEKFRKMLSENGSWKEVKGKYFSTYQIPLVESDEFLLHRLTFSDGGLRK